MEEAAAKPASKQENKQNLVQCSRNYRTLKMINEKRAMLK